MRTGKVTTTRRDGRPHVVPIWFVPDGQDLVFMTGAETVKVRALERTGWASLCVDDQASHEISRQERVDNHHCRARFAARTNPEGDHYGHLRGRAEGNADPQGDRDTAASTRQPARKRR
ncbi:MAG TPA: pyridoxamine 5'-phosphate oxidase family protein [Solirubrobacteraceae bacterium]|nr:pyridoxamine 5'-phosphate oxidase family protein [Solirubrobacteraceae bacterium]